MHTSCLCKYVIFTYVDIATRMGGSLASIVAVWVATRTVITLLYSNFFKEMTLTT